MAAGELPGYASWIDRLERPRKYPVMGVTGIAPGSPAPMVTNSGAKCSVLGWA